MSSSPESDRAGSPTEEAASEAQAAQTQDAAAPDLAVGDRVRLSQAPAYFKTADPMPMLRPPDLVSLEDEGVITEQRTGQSWAVRFEQGAFLLDRAYLTKVDG